MPKPKNSNYLVFNNETKANAGSAYGSLDKFNSVQKSTASDIRMRNPYDPDAYFRNRPLDNPPTRFRDVIYACRGAYLKVGVVRNVIDLMTDFACEDLQIIHPDKKVEAFFKVWIAKTKLKDAIDEFVRHFLVDGNVVVKRTLARISKPVEEQWMERTMIAQESEKLYVEDQVGYREIPWRYNFLNVSSLYWIGGDAARATGVRQLAFRPSESVLNAIRSPSDDFQRKLSESIPANVRTAVGTNNLVPLDMEELYVAHNKKDSWEDWAPPFLYAVLGDVAFKNKLRQAEMSALDGVINVIRLWKLGDHKEGFLPGDPAVEKLLNILETNTGGGAIDIVWDSMIDMKDYYPPIEKILGSEKYQQVNRDILIGLGVPEVLIGGQGANFSNSFIQLKTIIEKLNYIRDKLKEWLYQEVHLVCQAMDIPVAPKVRFNNMNLEDENVARKLIVGLLDRGVVSTEAVLQVYGEDFLVEMERIKSEKPILKAAGVDIKSPLDPKPVAGTKPTGGGGRPVKSIDTSRTQRKAKPVRASNDLIIMALDIIDGIDEFAAPELMDGMNVSNARKLTNEQKEDLNLFRRLILASFKPDDTVSKETILNSTTELTKSNYDLVSIIEKSIKDFVGKYGRSPTLAQTKRIEAVAWAEYYSV